MSLLSMPSSHASIAAGAASSLHDCDAVALAGEKLSLLAFHQLAGSMGGYSFVKVVLERAERRVHFINNDRYLFHADYIAERILNVPKAQIRAQIDDFNRKVYLSDERSYCLGILSLHQRDSAQFFVLETVEVDNMGSAMLLEFFQAIQQQLDASLPLFFKPANHAQEQSVDTISPHEMARMFNHELFATSDYVPLNKGVATGRLRVFDEKTYAEKSDTLRWYDIIVMDRVPDNIPRISGIINAKHTTPLSHTNVLACGWQIPNATQIGILDHVHSENLDGRWVQLTVDPKASAVELVAVAAPLGQLDRPKWSLQQIRLEEPEVGNTRIMPLDKLRMTDRFRFGTKAANLGELDHVLDHGSSRLTGFYRVRRPPRENLLNYLADALQVPASEQLADSAWKFLKGKLEVPRGIALPFALQREFLESSPKIQQAIGKLKMALELEAKEIDPLCLQIMNLIRSTRMSDTLRDYIDSKIAEHLGGVSSFVVRSSSNAEDLKDFSAAGIYESINHVTTADKIFESIKEVWASLISPRSVRLRQDVGISLDDCYMGVVIQEEITADFGGVMVTTNPMNAGGDFRNVYINASEKSAIEVVGGKSLPYQYLFNTVEGGGRTLSLGEAKEDLAPAKKRLMQDLAFCGRLMQSHFSADYTFASPLDIEWAARGDALFILQLRPYSV